MYAAVAVGPEPLTTAQLAKLRAILISPRMRVVRVTHGGSEQVQTLCLDLGIETHLRPATDADCAPCRGALRHPAAPAAERDAELGRDGWLLVVCPSTATEDDAEVWRAAHSARKPREYHNKGIFTVWPDGSHRAERYPRG